MSESKELRDARDELDAHKRRHGGRYVIGCSRCWQLLVAMREAEEATRVRV